MNRILIIDDDISTRLMLCNYLSPYYEVLTACKGSEGIAMAEMHTPNLIVCDVHMPDIDGFSVLKHIRQMKNMVNTPFIFLTASADYHTMSHGMTLGADDFLPKPILLNQLLQIIQILLDKARESQTLTPKAMDEL